jgi:tagaturonate reductase
MSLLPETILQFGAGNFLRAFADVFVHEANQKGQNIGRIVVVQSTNSSRAQQLSAQNCHYHVITQGIKNGQKIADALKVESISRALVAQQNWPQIITIAQSADLKYVFSNVTEAGLKLESDEAMDNGAPKSFPAKLLLVLKARFEAHQLGLTILPCELVERNGDLLRDLVIEQARLWDLDEHFQNWLLQENIWCNTLVDRIVSGKPDNHPLLAQDPLLTAAEPYALWAIEAPNGLSNFIANPQVIQTDNIDPYSLRKVRILNGAHTALVIRAMPLGIHTVREAIANPDIQTWLKRLLFEEICPVINERVDQAEKFASEVFDRFANPFLNHKLSDIALHQETKVQVRLISTYREYVKKFGKQPPLLSEILKEYL